MSTYTKEDQIRSPGEDRYSRLREAFEPVREVLMDDSWDCIERVMIACQQVRHLSPQDFPLPLRVTWVDLCSRMTPFSSTEMKRTSAKAASETMDEAGDIGCILLCIETLLRRDAYRLMDAA